MGVVKKCEKGQGAWCMVKSWGARYTGGVNICENGVVLGCGNGAVDSK